MFLLYIIIHILYLRYIDEYCVKIVSDENNTSFFIGNYNCRQKQKIQFLWKLTIYPSQDKLLGWDL